MEEHIRVVKDNSARYTKRDRQHASWCGVGLPYPYERPPSNVDQAPARF